ncbi:hypothetical protein Mal4_23010 [Maioricimonas rarisocia]|uniref:JmjC domain-containing protein n=1 Tax=Maioricimonas rarisocia TaxID=2528026 RepID=A0A517Z653_9PLAN|nr:cupin domain-containing protein [Maioricimonas rarisocia]QDU37982.1 hypothetical protein Mal4_23010 [Maioricimonas rarisocia]
MTSQLLSPPPTTTAPVQQSVGQRHLLAFNANDFQDCFSRRPFLIEHRLCNHPLFEVERILELARALPVSCIEYNAGKLPTSIDARLTPRNGLSVDETIRRIEECESWMVLKYVEQDPAYRDLLEACLKEIRPHSEQIAPGMTHAQAFVFLTSPGSVTPYHIDPEHNFLLQVRGSKTVRQWDGADRSILSEAELEAFYTNRGRNLEYREEIAEHAWTFDLQPGQGLHFPVTNPHWVQNGPEVSVSFSITFRTPDLDRRAGVHRVNAGLRRLGITPAPVGDHPGRDWYKYQAYRLCRRLRPGK